MFSTSFYKLYFSLLLVSVLLKCTIHSQHTSTNIFWGQGGTTCYLERYELLCLYNSLDVANHVTLEVFKLKEQAEHYT